MINSSGRFIIHHTDILDLNVVGIRYDTNFWDLTIKVDHLYHISTAQEWQAQ